MKKYFFIVVTVCLFFCSCTSTITRKEENKSLEDVRIGVIQYTQHQALDDSYEGFLEVLIEAGLSVENIDYNVATTIDNCQIIADKLANSCDLIFAIATPALQAAYAATKDIPIVGCAITDYESTKLVNSNEVPGGNVTGTSDLNPIASQFDLMKEILPDVNTVAIIYCGSEDNSIFEGKIAVENAEKHGLNWKVYTVTDSNDIQVVVNKIVADKVDAIYIPNDNLLTTYMSSVEAIASEAKIPCIVSEEGMCKNGGLATYGLNYINLGRTSGFQALSILNGESSPAEMPIQYFSSDDCDVIFNLKVAKKLGIELDLEKYPNAIIIE